MKIDVTKSPAAATLHVVLIYALFAGLWIVLTNDAVGWLFHDPHQIVVANTIKGCLFVAFTSFLLYGLIRRLLDHAQHASEREAAALRESSFGLRLLTSIAENSSDAIFAKDLQGRFLLFNPEMQRLIGKSADKVLGRDGDTIFPGAEAELMSSNDRRVIAENRIITFEHEISAAQGRTVVQATLGPLHGADGSAVGLFGVVRDLTDRRMAEQRLLESEALYRNMFEDNPHPMWVYDFAAQAFLAVNDAAIAHLGYPREEFLALNLRDLQPLAEVEQVERMVNDATAQNKESGPWHFSCKDRRVVRLALTSHGLKYRTRPAQLFLAQDITERLRAEEQLRKLSQAIEQSPESILITDVRARIEYVNEAFTRNNGYTREEVIGSNPRILHSGKTPPEVYASMWQAMAQGQTWKGEFYNRRKDGSEYIEFAFISPLRQADGTITHYVAVQEDITEKKRLGEELDRHRHHLEELVEQRTADLARAQHLAEAANQAKSAFLANMSHEIRTPMNAIIGLTHLLQRTELNPEQADRLDMIDSASRHLLSIVNDILDLSKIEANRLQLANSDFQLSVVLGEAASIIAQSARNKGLAVEIECDTCAGQDPLWLSGDEVRLRQALLNYAGNAVKFTEKGRIVLRANVLEDSGNELLVRFEVTDTGIGIAPDKLGLLFQVFEQGDASITRKYGGTGLGLAITRRLAQLMGGDAGTDSVPGAGSTFWFTARLRRSSDATPATYGENESNVEAQLRRQCGGARILLAEDNVFNREVAVELLHAAGLIVDAAENGRDAVERALTHEYDLILMDLQMPEMDGLTATRAIRAMPAWVEKPILAMTATVFDQNHEMCIEAGMSDVVSKPVQPNVLYGALLKWLPRSVVAGERSGLALPTQTIKPSRAKMPRSLIEFNGLDSTLPLSALRGDVHAYVGLLRQFADRHRDETSFLYSRFADGETEAMLARVHTLKGAAGTVGATSIHALAVALEQMLHADPQNGMLPSLLNELQLAQNALDHALERIADASGEAYEFAIDPGKVLAVLAQMESLLAADDTEVAEVFAANRAGLLSMFGTQAMQIDRQIAKFDYPQALETLKSIRADVEQGHVAERV